MLIFKCGINNIVLGDSLTEKNKHEKWMNQAVAEALAGVKKGDGGPFGALVIKENQLVALAHNMVLATNDPTSHAEITAIRLASQQLGRFNLSDCAIYCSCEPCPMCLAAIYWARIPEIYYACTTADAAKIGFDDHAIYNFIRDSASNSHLKMEQIFRVDYLAPMNEWEHSSLKISY